MGHSTGSQDIMHYLLAAGERPRIDGGIMQGGISDREAIDMLMIPELREESVRVARQYVRERRENDMLPDRLTSTMFPASISAKRWLSLVSPGPEHAGEDDYFSSDLNDERLRKTFGRLGEKKTPIFILYGENDPYVPPEVNKVDLVEKWKGHIRKGGGLVDEGSGVIPGMSHSVKEMGASLDGMTGRVVGFLTKIEDESIGEGSKESTVKHCP